MARKVLGAGDHRVAVDHESHRAGLEPCGEGHHRNTLLASGEHRVGAGGAEVIAAGRHERQGHKVGATGVDRHVEAGVLVVALALGHDVACELELREPLKAHAHLAQLGAGGAGGGLGGDTAGQDGGENQQGEFAHFIHRCHRFPAYCWRQ